MVPHRSLRYDLGEKFPALHPTVAIFFRIADAQGEYDLRVEFHDSARRCLSPIGGISLKVSDRRGEGDVGFLSRLAQNENRVSPSMRLTPRGLSGSGRGSTSRS